MADDPFREHLAETGCVMTPVSPEFLEWLKAHKAPQAILDIFAGGVPKRVKRRAKRFEDDPDFYTEREIRKEADEFPRYLKAGLLAIGSGALGDHVALDLRKQVGAIGYISHEDVWGDEEAKIRQFFAVLAPNLADYTRQVREGLLPKDYHQAKGRKK